MCLQPKVPNESSNAPARFGTHAQVMARPYSPVA